MPMHGKKKSKMMNKGGATKKSKMMNKGGAGMKKKTKYMQKDRERQNPRASIEAK